MFSDSLVNKLVNLIFNHFGLRILLCRALLSIQVLLTRISFVMLTICTLDLVSFYSLLHFPILHQFLKTFDLVQEPLVWIDYIPNVLHIL